MSSLLSSIKNPSPPKDALSSLPTPPTLPGPTRLVVALATISATNDPLPFLPPSSGSAWRAAGKEWAVAVHRMLQLDEAGLPSSVSAEQVRSAAEAHWGDMQPGEREDLWGKVVDLLVMASIFQPPIKGEQVQTVQVDKEAASGQDSASEKIKAPETVPTLSYTPIARRFIYTTLHLLHIPTSPHLATTEHQLASRLYTTLQRLHATDVESARASQAEGWGGSTGRWVATGAGAIIGGVAIGLTGGLAAPAIAALVPGFMTFGLLTSATAPVVIGSVFGLAGGGLTSKRVRERWRGVGEFEFVDVKMGIEEKEKSSEKEQPDTVPSLIATIVVPGLLTKSRTEAIDAWREKIIPASTLHDGRDIYVLKYETEHMLQTGKAIDSWVTSKLKGYVKKEVIKRTVLSAYFMAVSLPMSVYNMASLGLDNTWVQSQDKAIKAGRLLGEVLEKQVQGQRPVVLVGSSLGALTILHALLYLSSRAATTKTPLPQIVDSAFLISLPSAPSTEEWQACRQVVARRLVNAWCEKDLVLAGIVRLHEVLSRAVTLQNGVHVAGLRAVNQPGVEDVDLSDVIEGHLDIQRQMGEVLKVIRIDE
ncbi:hypothetical protein QFC20_004816 [Naganishia adeliensis]|uniref:Uncharacterized protein n=1 Tax=Naganishia adeliensis TaxID=92952 RepID=A0ACC2VV41_9TREE|nr:hypothetical protein QFC20_004816 [Naganishia adeliensis]